MENTHSQTQDHTTSSPKITITGYSKPVFDEVDMDSETETLEEVQAISDNESCLPEDSENPSEDEVEQWLPKQGSVADGLVKGYSPHSYYRNISSGRVCNGRLQPTSCGRDYRANSSR